MRESAVSSHIRLDAAQLGNDLWRNNTGSLPDQNGRWIRYGLCNDSKEINEIVKSSDLIGPTPTLITQEMVGHILGVFTGIESKPTGWRLIPSDKRGYAQKNFHDIVLRAGGYAGFATCIEDYRRIIRR